MLLLVQDRKNNSHLVNYTSSIGNKYTVCGRPIIKNSTLYSITLTTLALDNAIHNICPICCKGYEKIYGDALENSIRTAHSLLNDKLDSQFRFPNLGHPRPESKYWNMESKYWQKLSKYKQKILRK
jgi:hypothetical protein